MNTTEIRNRLWIDAIIYDAPRESFEWGPGVQEHYAIHYIKKGKGVFECSGTKYFLEKGQCFLLSPAQLVHYYPDPKDPWEYAWIGFSGIEAKNMIAQTSAFRNGPVSEQTDKQFDSLFRSAADDFRENSPADDLRNLGHFYLLLSYLIEKFPVSCDHFINNNTAALRAADMIEKNYRRQNLNIDFLTKAVQMNRTSLYRHFMQEFQMSPKEYLIRVRMDRAKELLRNSSFPIKSIAYSVGYSDQLYFSKVFKEKTGDTPTDYRNKFSKENSI